MVASLRDLLVVLQSFFPGALSIEHACYILALLTTLGPLVRLHNNQRREPRQPPKTGWYSAISSLISTAYTSGPNADSGEVYSTFFSQANYPERLIENLDVVLELLGVQLENCNENPMFPTPRQILCTSRINCMFCSTADKRSLRRRVAYQSVRYLDHNFKWTTATVFIGHCSTCRSDYYPDKVTYMHEGKRRAKLEYSAQSIRVSKTGVWMHRRVAVAQEKALCRFRSGWSNFADWLTEVSASTPSVTAKQSQRLFMEHFTRRLIVAHGLDASFYCKANPSLHDLVSVVRDTLGANGGILPFAMDHGCLECSHPKRYRADLDKEGADLSGTPSQIADVSPAILAPNSELESAPGNDLPPGMPAVPSQVTREPGEARGYVRMAVMDGKMITHRKCAIDTCDGDLTNYKNGRFCQDHINMKDICGIIPCGQPVHSPGEVTCNLEAHKAWHQKYSARFTRMSFPGVQRVMRRNQAIQEVHGQSSGSNLRIELPELNGAPGNEVVHTFRAKSTYCLQTVQWACGTPIGWGKCYRSESPSQVLAIISRVWSQHPALLPGFLAYDDACDLLRHIVTQDSTSPWIRSTKFIVDAFHYIGHQATDILCRTWCNPAPANGSQPDLVLTERDDNGDVHLSRAFNTETAEQFNSWLNGFEPMMRQMSAATYDVFVHILMLLYFEMVQTKVSKRDLELSDEFWRVVESTE